MTREELRRAVFRLTALGLSRSQVAEKLGITRNAAIGIIYRGEEVGEPRLPREGVSYVTILDPNEPGIFDVEHPPLQTRMPWEAIDEIYRGRSYAT